MMRKKYNKDCDKKQKWRIKQEKAEIEREEKRNMLLVKKEYRS